MRLSIPRRPPVCRVTLLGTAKEEGQRAGDSDAGPGKGVDGPQHAPSKGFNHNDPVASPDRASPDSAGKVTPNNPTARE